LGNLIPDWNDAVYQGRWKDALRLLHSTNNFPEFTGRICPAPCEASCVLAINDEPVTIEYIEKEIIEKGFRENWITPQIPKFRTGKKVAVVGSGPAGLAAADQLNVSGHAVTVFERDEYIGGLLTLGIPDFKLDKNIVNRRVDLLSKEGINFQANTNVGVDISTENLLKQFDAVCLAGGSTIPRVLDVPGADLNGIHVAMKYLTQQNRVLAGHSIGTPERITAEGKSVIILGGGDTGSDCLGTAHRQNAKQVYQFEILDEPPDQRPTSNPWPLWPMVLRSSHAHEEGGLRDYGIMTKSFSGENGTVTNLHAVRVSWESDPNTGRQFPKEIPGSDFQIKADLVLLAMGFLHPQHNGLIKEIGVNLDARGNVPTDDFKMTNITGVFSAGDMSRGQSLVVWAIAEGRQAAYGIDRYLMNHSSLPSVDLRGWE
jgi:glutamate synthase (NADPH/NADH) small chain